MTFANIRDAVESVLVGFGIVGILGAALLWHDRRSAEIGPVSPVYVNDSTQVLQARLRATRHELDALKEATKTTGGTLVAGVRIVVKAETVFVDRIVRVTDTLSDGTRVATVRDTLANGAQVSIDARAPIVGPLEIGYNVIFPELAPEFGFIRRGDAYYAVASIAGRTFTPEQAFFTVQKPRRLSLIAGGQLMTDADRVRLFGLAGFGLRLNDRSNTFIGLTTGNQLLMQGLYRVF